MDVKVWEGPVYLEPIEHVYINRKTNEKYVSVTKVLHELVNPFNEQAVAEAIVKQPDKRKKEKYLNLNKEQILENWKKLNDDANEYGTFIHELIEEYLFKEKFFFPEDDFSKKIIDSYENLDIDEGETMWPERIMFSKEHELAGTADLIIDIDDYFFDVGDWKGLAVDTPIFTDSGWKTMGTICKDDKVYDMNGDLTKIRHLSSVKNKKCYEIRFDNNETIVADYEHRWLISFLKDKKLKDVVMTTEELSNYLNALNKTDKKWTKKLPKIKIAKPLNNDFKELPIDPYVLGVWLGKGNESNSKVLQSDEIIWEEINLRGYEIESNTTSRMILGLESKLMGLNLINNKHLPEIYLLSSYEQRLDVLRGFMDVCCDFHESNKGYVVSDIVKSQVDYFNCLISSLGIKGTLIEDKNNNTYTVCFNTNKLDPFLCRNEEVIKNNKNINLTFKNIVSVEEVESVATRCIEVDSETHTFLYGHTFSLTHNTNIAFDFHDKFGNKTLKKPLDHLQDCHYSIYTCQLSIYAYMYELETGKKCRQMWIGYWDRVTETINRIPIMYLKNEAKKVLDLHKYKMKFA